MSLDRGRSVFVVDDEKIIAQTLAAILKQAGFDAKAFEDAQSAIEAANSSAPELMITDVVMPGMSGIELAILFQTRWPACKVILFSGQASTADMLETARKEGHEFDILAKPIHPADLLVKLGQ
jgi:DNA-binding NtrC family response regulator